MLKSKINNNSTTRGHIFAISCWQWNDGSKSWAIITPIYSVHLRQMHYLMNYLIYGMLFFLGIFIHPPTWGLYGKRNEYSTKCCCSNKIAEKPAILMEFPSSKFSSS